MDASDNQRLTQVGRGTAGGTLLRSYWQPAALAEELGGERQIQSGLSGLDTAATPPPAADSPYAPSAGPELPRTLGEAVEAFGRGDLYRSVFGGYFVEYLSGIKRAEWSRFLASVTDWEQREYFELF